MKWLNSKYAYLLIILSLAVSISLQGVWLRQLFITQKRQLKKDIEQTVSTAAIQTLYNSLINNQQPDAVIHSGRFKEFFLSEEWLQMRQAFDNIKINGVHNKFNYGTNADSSFISMQVSFSNKSSNKPDYATDIKWNKETGTELQQIETKSIKMMDSAVRHHLTDMGIKQQTGYALFNYGLDTLVKTTLSPERYKKAVFRTAHYSYNLKHLNKYQLVIDDINSIVIFQMRYYLLSSLLMILLTGTAFYFLIKLLQNQRLYAAAKHDFTSNMTHEFKTPVATVAVALESITKYKLINNPQKLQNYLDISRQELQRLNLMIEKVLNLNQEDETLSTLQFEFYDVQSDLKKVISSMQVQLENSRSVIDFQPSAEPCFVSGDPVHLTNVFYNLIDNAIKYAGPELQLKISCLHKTDEIRISFKDNGPGIKDIYSNQIFERFFRIPLTGDTHNVKGSGLGLHYVKGIIEKHNGRIIVKSTMGKGSDFIITLPVQQDV